MIATLLRIVRGESLPVPTTRVVRSAGYRTRASSVVSVRTVKVGRVRELSIEIVPRYDRTRFALYRPGDDENGRKLLCQVGFPSDRIDDVIAALEEVRRTIVTTPHGDLR